MNHLKQILLCILTVGIQFLGFSQNEKLNASKSDHIPFIDLLENGEQYKIEFMSYGCFHSGTNELTVKRKNDKYFVNYKDSLIEIDSTKTNYVRNFETELFKDRVGGCTTTDNYALIFKRQKLEIMDGSCSWRGFNKLLENLNLIEK